MNAKLLIVVVSAVAAVTGVVLQQQRHNEGAKARSLSQNNERSEARLASQSVANPYPADQARADAFVKKILQDKFASIKKQHNKAVFVGVSGFSYLNKTLTEGQKFPTHHDRHFTEEFTVVKITESGVDIGYKYSIGPGVGVEQLSDALGRVRSGIVHLAWK